MNMSDAESTIKFAVLDGYSSATGHPNQDEARVQMIFESIFKPSTRWAIEQYLEELKGGE
jgi:hypothetical protein